MGGAFVGDSQGGLGERSAQARGGSQRGEGGGEE